MPDRSAKPGPRYVALLQILRTAEALWNSSRLFFARWDLSPSQFNVLNLLNSHPEGLSQVELSRELIMHRSNVTGLVDRLEERRLVQRQPSLTDRRVYQVVLTSSGCTLVQEVLPHYYKAAEKVWGNFPIDRAQTLVADLQQVAQNAAAVDNESGKAS